MNFNVIYILTILLVIVACAIYVIYLLRKGTRHSKVAKKNYLFYLGAGATSPFLKADNKQVNTKNLTDALCDESLWERLFSEIEVLKNTRDADYWTYNFNIGSKDVIRLLKIIFDKNNMVLPEEIAKLRGDANISLSGYAFNFEYYIYFLDKICSFLHNGYKGDIDSILYDSKSLEEFKVKAGWFQVPILARELIVRYILDVWQSLPETSKKKSIDENKIFYAKFLEKANVDIYTLNYDPLIYEAVKNLDIDTGFKIKDTERILKFSGEDYLKSVNTLSFLHGFVGFFPRSDSKQIILNEDYQSLSQKRIKALFKESELGYDLKTWHQTRKAFCRDTFIITGLDKYTAFYAYPYSTYLYRFSEAVKKADSIIIMGSSLDDEHLNLFLNNALFSGVKKVICVDYITDEDIGDSGKTFFANIKSPVLKFWFQFSQSGMSFSMNDFSDAALTRSLNQKHKDLKEKGWCQLTSNLCFYRKGTEQFLTESILVAKDLGL